MDCQTCYNKVLAIFICAVAGFSDSVGFLSTDGLFVSFMSGNTTTLGSGIITGNSKTITAGALIVCFTGGVVGGASLGRLLRAYKTAAILSLATAFLTGAWAAYRLGFCGFAVFPIAVAMGVQNTVFVGPGDVKVGLTYVTGALVALGKGISGMVWDGKTLGLAPLYLWLSLLTGAAFGSRAFKHWGLNALMPAIVVMCILVLTSAVSAALRVRS